MEIKRSRTRWIVWTVMTIVLATTMPALAGSAIVSKSPLADLSADASATDGAWAVATAAVAQGQTTVTLNLKALDRDAAGTTYGAHVHTGPCVAGDGAAASGHYNHGGGISSATEVWLDFTITNGGTGHATAVVPFAIPPGAAHSIVIHALPTNPGDGSAGPRLACLPLEF